MEKEYAMTDFPEVHNELSLEYRHVNILPEPLPGQKNDGFAIVEVTSHEDPKSHASNIEAFFASPLRASIFTGLAVFVFCTVIATSIGLPVLNLICTNHLINANALTNSNFALALTSASSFTSTSTFSSSPPSTSLSTSASTSTSSSSSPSTTTPFPSILAPPPSSSSNLTCPPGAVLSTSSSGPVSNIDISHVSIPQTGCNNPSTFQSLYTTHFNETFLKTCNANFIGSDIVASVVDSWELCMESCSIYNRFAENGRAFAASSSANAGGATPTGGVHGGGSGSGNGIGPDGGGVGAANQCKGVAYTAEWVVVDWAMGNTSGLAANCFLKNQMPVGTGSVDFRSVMSKLQE